jgi:hypothetical protein
MEDSTRKVKIITTEYDDKQNLLKWSIVDLETNKTVKLVIPAEDFGIKPEFPKDIGIKFCNDMKGKEINLVSKYIKQLSFQEMKDAGEEGVFEMKKELNQFPIYEAMVSEGLINENSIIRK